MCPFLVCSVVQVPVKAEPEYWNDGFHPWALHYPHTLCKHSAMQEIMKRYRVERIFVARLGESIRSEIASGVAYKGAKNAEVGTERCMYVCMYIMGMVDSFALSVHRWGFAVISSAFDLAWLRFFLPSTRSLEGAG